MGETGRAATETERVVDEVFLSPRVVDSATFAEFAESLGELLRRAAEQREHLRRTVAEGESVASTLRDSTSQATEKLRPAAKLVPAIDQKLSLVEEMLVRADEATRSLERCVGEATKAASGDGIAAARQAQQAIDQSLSRARELEGRLGQLAQRAEMAVELLNTECKGKLDTAASHAQDVLGTLVAEIDTRAERALERLTALIDERKDAAEAALTEALAVGARAADSALEADAAMDETTAAVSAEDEAAAAELVAAARAREEIEALLDALREQVRERRQTVEAVSQEAEDRVAAELGAAARAREEVESLLDSLRAQARERALDIERGSDEAEQRAAAAEARLAIVRQELASVDARGREIAAAANQALAAFDEELAGRMHAVREMMEQLASISGGEARTPDAPPRPDGAPAPTATVESKPLREPAGFVRIDRPVGSETPAGLPGHLKF